MKYDTTTVPTAITIHVAMQFLIPIPDSASYSSEHGRAHTSSPV
jgi:hypothetical protein